MVIKAPLLISLLLLFCSVGFSQVDSEKRYVSDVPISNSPKYFEYGYEFSIMNRTSDEINAALIDQIDIVELSRHQKYSENVVIGFVELDLEILVYSRQEAKNRRESGLPTPNDDH